MKKNPNRTRLEPEPYCYEATVLIIARPCCPTVTTPNDMEDKCLQFNVSKLNKFSVIEEEILSFLAFSVSVTDQFFLP